MEINPTQQLLMLTTALLRGAMLGLFWEALAALRIVLGAYRPPERMRQQYAKRLPLLHRSVPFEKKGRLGRLGRGTLTAVLDLLFCLLFTVTVLLTLYAYADGRIRLSVPLVMLGGFGLMHAAATTVLSPLMAYFAYGLAAAVVYLTALLRLLVRPLHRLLRAVRRYRQRRVSAALCAAQLKQAAQGVLGGKNVERKGRRHYGKKNMGQNNASAMGDTHPDPDHFRGGSGRQRSQRDGGGAQQGTSAAGAGRNGSAAK